MASKNVRIVNLSNNAVLAESARVADSFLSRMIGLLSSPPLQPGDGLLLKPCAQIHMMGMRFPLDAVFFDADMKVVGIVEGLAPGQISPFFAGAKSCLELPCGVIAQSQTRVGDQAEAQNVT